LGKYVIDQPDSDSDQDNSN